MANSNEMAFIKPRPPYFPMETRQFLEGFNLSSAQLKTLALLEIDFMKNLAVLEIEFYDKVIKVLENMESKG